MKTNFKVHNFVEHESEFFVFIFVEILMIKALIVRGKMNCFFLYLYICNQSKIVGLTLEYPRNNEPPITC